MPLHVPISSVIVLQILRWKFWKLMYYHSHHSHKYKSYPSYEVHEVILSLFNNNKLVLNHTFIFLILLISFMNSLGLGLVMIQLMSSPERTEWIWYYHLNFWRVINVSKISNGRSIACWGTSVITPHLEKMKTFNI